MTPAGHHLTLLVHAATASTRDATFPADEPLDRYGTAHATRLQGRLPRAVHHLRSPDRACAGTCAALGLTAEPDPALRDPDPGRWAGQRLDDVAAAEPDAVATWLSDPSAAPHGGESLVDLLDRLRSRLDTLPVGHTLAVVGPAVARAAVVLAIGAPPSGIWRVDAAPLTVTDLRGGPGRWTVRMTGRPLDSEG
ncbi:histidine phosphatase family protein [Pseudonocardia nematodicida]|uniref:Histidine phosphatase family protein n=1 Tax=Pseudonocardia nematodicida TaxID=1206997 RepID=A0ABV1KAA8_9PSEU